jgi:hypothetical protein
MPVEVVWLASWLELTFNPNILIDILAFLYVQSDSVVTCVAVLFSPGFTCNARGALSYLAAIASLIL